LEKLLFVDEVTGPEYGKNKHYEFYEVSLKQNPYDKKSIESIPKIKKQAVKALQDAGVAGTSHLWIGGVTSSLYDTANTTERDMKILCRLSF